MTRSRRCALILVDLDAPASLDNAALDGVLARWAQETRFAAVVDVEGVRAGDAHGVVIDAPLDAVAHSLAALVK